MSGSRTILHFIRLTTTEFGEPAIAGVLASKRKKNHFTATLIA
jgi:hypothetical protein